MKATTVKQAAIKQDLIASYRSVNYIGQRLNKMLLVSSLCGKKVKP